jgi:tetratricopeptide (TPR) repeat protein
MNWTDFKLLFDEQGRDSLGVDSLLETPELWRMDEASILHLAGYLYKGAQFDLCLRFIDAMFRHGFALSPENALLIRHLKADALHAVKRYSEAVDVYGEILTMERTDVAYANRGLAYWELCNYERALDDYLEAIRLNSRNAIALRGAGEMLVKLEKPYDAVSHLSAAIDVDPNYAKAFTALGIAYFHCKEWGKSYRALKRAVSLDPNDRIALKGIKELEAVLD